MSAEPRSVSAVTAGCFRDRRVQVRRFRQTGPLSSLHSVSRKPWTKMRIVILAPVDRRSVRPGVLGDIAQHRRHLSMPPWAVHLSAALTLAAAGPRVQVWTHATAAPGFPTG